MVVRHDLCLFVISYAMCLAHITFASAFYSDVIMSLMLYPVVYHSHIWMQDVLDLVDISMPNPFCSYCIMLIETK